tara:strand:+ start:298 stop:552 length:255 start_codon:yes stop_codon:yes gene_type:complete
MIAFNKDFEESNKENLINNLNLQNLLDLVSNVKLKEEESFKNVDLSKILELIYNSLFLEENSQIDLTIVKSKNNSLNLLISSKK